MKIIRRMVSDIWSVTDRIFSHFRTFFSLLFSWQPRKSQFWQNEKNNSRYHFMHVYHEWKSYDVCFLRYEVWQTDLFVVLGPFLSFCPTNNAQKSKFWKNEIKTWRYCHFKHEYQKLWSYAIPFLRYGAWWM